MSLDTQPIGAFVPTAGPTVTPIFKNWNGNGDISILEAYIVPGASGVMTATLVQIATGGFTTGSATLDATLGTFGSAANVNAAGSAATCTIGTTRVAENHWVAVSMGAGTVGANSQVYVNYVKGV